jgi:hypothetical protein
VATMYSDVNPTAPVTGRQSLTISHIDILNMT